jgi:ribonuclease HI
MLQNQMKYTHLIEQIRTKVIKLEYDEWKVEFSWIKAHTGHQGNELAANWLKKQQAAGPSASATPEYQRVRC